MMAVTKRFPWTPSPILDPKLRVLETREIDDVRASPSQFMSLPTELHLQISQYLSYPDALALKHTNQHFYAIVYTGVHLKVEWLIERRLLHLDWPHDKSCELGSDTRFCKSSVR